MPRLKGQLKSPDAPLVSLNKVGHYVFYGLEEIATHMRCSPATVKRWAKEHGFPAMKAPNGSWSTTTGLIDSWVLARYRLGLQNARKL